MDGFLDTLTESKTLLAVCKLISPSDHTLLCLRDINACSDDKKLAMGNSTVRECTSLLADCEASRDRFQMKVAWACDAHEDEVQQ